MDEDKFICHQCGISFTARFNLNKHLKIKHGTINRDHCFMRCEELNCNYVCRTLNNLRSHLISNHDFKIDMQELRFGNMQEFLLWKSQEETLTKFSWVKHSRTVPNKTMYWCNRSGKPRLINDADRKRTIKSQGSCKLNKTCTSSITVMQQENETTVTVQYFKTHYQHGANLAHVNLNENEKNTIVSQLIQGIPPSEILDKIREDVDNEFQRIHLINLRDIHNIAQSYHISKDGVQDKNDAISVDLWVKSMEKDILLYKKQGEADENMPAIYKDDFLLGFASPIQIYLLQKFGTSGIICMDATHGTNPYDFKLITLLTIDDFGEGYPVAFFICNREDYISLKLFIQALKNKSGNIAANSFMTDDAEQYFAAWSAVMNGPCIKKLLCMWHVDKAWRNKLTLIKNKEKQEKVYKTLCTLRQETTIENFNQYLGTFVQMLLSDTELKEFGCMS